MKLVNNEKYGKREIKQFLLNNIDFKNISKRPRLLDVGCGNGSFLYLFKDEKFDLEGLEPGKVMVNFARENLSLEVLEGLLVNNDLKPGSYDILSALALIEHVIDPKNTLNKMWELLKPNGYILLTTPSFRDIVPIRGVENFFKFVHTYYFTEKSLGSLMKQAGFEVEKIWIKKSGFQRIFPFGMIPKTAVLCILGRKINAKADKPDVEDVEELTKLFADAKRKYFLHSFVSRVLRYPFALYYLLKSKLAF